MPSREAETIARLERELAKERAAHQSTRDLLAATEARARAWRRVARWIWAARG